MVSTCSCSGIWSFNSHDSSATYIFETTLGRFGLKYWSSKDLPHDLSCWSNFMIQSVQLIYIYSTKQTISDAFLNLALALFSANLIIVVVAFKQNCLFWNQTTDPKLGFNLNVQLDCLISQKIWSNLRFWNLSWKDFWFSDSYRRSYCIQLVFLNKY